MRGRPFGPGSWPESRLLWALRQSLSRFSRRFGWLGWCVLLLLAVAGAALVSERQQLHQAALARAQAARHNLNTPLLVTAVPDEGPARLAAFERLLLPQEDLPLLVQDLLDLAEASRLAVRRGDYRAVADEPGGFMRYQMSLPVKGEPRAIEQFIQVALRANKALALQSVQFQRERADANEVEARIQWVAMARMPAQPRMGR